MSAWNAIELCTQSSQVRLVDGNAWQKENADKEVSLLRERPRLRLWKPQTFEKV